MLIDVLSVAGVLLGAGAYVAWIVQTGRPSYLTRAERAHLRSVAQRVGHRRHDPSAASVAARELE